MITNKQKAVVQKYVEQLKEIELRYVDDKEVLHSYADEALLSAMIELGFQEVADAYIKCSELGFWYA